MSTEEEADQTRFNELRCRFGPDGDADQLELHEFALLSDTTAEVLLGRIESFKLRGELAVIRNRNRAKLMASAMSPQIGKQKTVFQVKAAIRNCVLYKGYRSSLYLCAQRCEAFYLEDKAASIRYEGNNLLVNLLFESKKDAHSFQNALLEFKESRFAGHETISVDEDVIELLISSNIKLERVFHHHYDTSTSESPPCLTLADIASVSSDSTEAEFGVDSERFMRSLEDLKLLTPETSLYRCHIAPKSRYPKYKRDEDNIIYATWDFHNHFDGLHNASKEPEIAVQFQSFGEEEDVLVNQQVFRRRKLFVLLEYRKENIAAWMAKRLKEGSEILAPLMQKSFLFVKDVEKSKRFLEIKYEETIETWYGR